jgi:hypothetical protein
MERSDSHTGRFLTVAARMPNKKKDPPCLSRVCR